MINTNIRYKNFKQQHFTAGDQQQFVEKINTSLPFKNDIKDIDVDRDNIYKEQIINNLDFEKYKNLNETIYLDTFKYIFYKFKKGIYIKIVDNKVELFLPFSNANFTNEISHTIEYPDMEFFKNICIQEGYIFNERLVNKFKNRWYFNNALVRYEYPINETDHNTSVIKEMFEEVCAHKKIPDIEFFINKRDFPLLSTHGYEPYFHLYNKTNHKLVSHDYEKYTPILSMCNNDLFADILIPTYEDWIHDTDSKVNLQWKDKKSIAVFRGATTGVGTDITDNQRLHLCYIATLDDNYKYIDAGITKWKLRPRVKNNKLCTIDVNKLPFGLRDKLSLYEQSLYKYIINVDGNVSAFRLSSELSTKSVILMVQSKYNWKIWFSDMLKPYVHYIPIKADLSDLLSVINWCKDNDKKCEEIAVNAYEFYNKYLSRSAILDYLQKILIELKKTTGYYVQTQNIRVQPEKYNHVLYDKLQVKNNIEIFKSKTTTIYVGWCEQSCMKLNSKCIIKSTCYVEKIEEFIHDSFVGLFFMNNIEHNFSYTYGIIHEDDKYSIIREYVDGMTLQQYISSLYFNLADFLLILLQLFYTLIIAQKTYKFVHYDLTTWNILIKRYKRKQIIKYDIPGLQIFKIETKNIPIIIDFGKSYICYENKEYFSLFDKFDSCIDCLSIFITSIFQIIVEIKLSKTEFVQLLRLANYISNTKYCDKVFKNAHDVKDFFYHAKKYNNLIYSPKYELSNKTPLDFANFIHEQIALSKDLLVAR